MCVAAEASPIGACGTPFMIRAPYWVGVALATQFTPRDHLATSYDCGFRTVGYRKSDWARSTVTSSGVLLALAYMRLAARSPSRHGKRSRR